MNPKLLIGLAVGGLCCIGVVTYQWLVPPPPSYSISEGVSINSQFVPLLWAVAGYLIVQYVPSGTLRDLLLRFVQQKSGGVDVSDIARLVQSAIKEGTDLYEVLKLLYDTLKANGATEAELQAIRKVAAARSELRFGKDFEDETRAK